MLLARKGYANFYQRDEASVCDAEISHSSAGVPGWAAYGERFQDDLSSDTVSFASQDEQMIDDWGFVEIVIPSGPGPLGIGLPKNPPGKGALVVRWQGRGCSLSHERFIECRLYGVDLRVPKCSHRGDWSEAWTSRLRRITGARSTRLHSDHREQ